ncbi:MAG TPA: L,D-transpeptidase family protein [Ferruginibacter sp.]|nr:L,D-transpeptidase family protein [Ferruginibacter sp.]
MQQSKDQYQYLTLLIILLFLFSCNRPEKIKDKEIVTDPRTMDSKVAENIQTALQFALDNTGKIDDSTRIFLAEIVADFYKNMDHVPVWSKTGEWQSLADSLYQFIEQAETEGLFPEDYHFKHLRSLKNKLDTDSLSRMDAVLWTKADLLLTDGFMRIVKDLRLGRLYPDSVTLNKDSVADKDFFTTTLKTLLEEKQFTQLLITLQPIHKEYWELKKGIKSFVDSMDRKLYTHLNYPYKKADPNDSLLFVKTLQKRLFESNYIDFNDRLPDSVQLAKVIKNYQVQKKLTADGKFGRILVQSLNNNDVEKFKRIAITLDKYKQLPKKMPEKYIWVNIAGYYLWLIEKDTMVFQSKVIVGKPETRTPLLTAAITDMITYPTWTVPNSIIVKQYLPKLKNNPNYISKIGLKLVDNKGETIDPNTVNWSKYSRGIPYKVMQASGDNNSLGVIKFNFNNPYAVYLHDTNQRYLFKNVSRALSHGCVRVQEWEKLAFYIAGNDSIASLKNDSLKYTSDSIRNWITRKERHRIDVKNHIPLFIRYFSCEGRNGQLKFYDDVYGEDKQLMEKYFAGK